MGEKIQILPSINFNPQSMLCWKLGKMTNGQDIYANGIGLL